MRTTKNKVTMLKCILIASLMFINVIDFQMQTSCAKPDGTVRISSSILLPQANGTSVMDLIKAGGKTKLTISLANSITPIEAETFSYTVTKAGGLIRRSVNMQERGTAVKVDVSDSSVGSIIEDLSKLKCVKNVGPELRCKLESTPNDSNWTLQWGMQKIQADWAWNTTFGNDNVLVATIDTGIQTNHPDLLANYVPLGRNWPDNTDDVTDRIGHGTHCAGIIAASINNCIGVAGLAQVKIMAENVFGSDSGATSASDTDIAAAICHATNCGANIISMSLGTSEYSYVLHDAVKYAYDRGVLLVAAAGNDACPGKSYPAGFDEVVGVTATNQTDGLASFSNYGDWIELAAPGVSIYSTTPTYSVQLTRYGLTPNNSYCSGTSMACPHVAGLAALVLSRYPNMTRDQLRHYLRHTADDLGSPGFDIQYGYGRVNAKKAIQQGLSEHDLIITKLETPAYASTAWEKINATILNFGSMIESNIQVQLWRNGSLFNTTTIPQLGSGMESPITWNVNLQFGKTYNITAYTIPRTGENRTCDNRAMRWIGSELGIIRVPNDFLHVQDAVQAATTGDKILVASGIYQEIVSIYKPGISLVGNKYSDTIIDGCSKILDGHQVGCTNGFIIVADNVTVSNFTVRNTRKYWYTDSGIKVNSKNATVCDNYLLNNNEGITLWGASYSSIFRNMIISSCDCGLLAFTDHHNNIVENIFRSSRNFGVALTLSPHDSVARNSITFTQYYDSIFVIGENCSVHDNFVLFTKGLGYSETNPYKYAIDLRNSRYVLANDNYVRNNSAGVWSFYNQARIYHNNMINNTIQLVDPIGSDDTLNDRWASEGNYWSDYGGTDGNGDGIGDIAYQGTDLYPLMKPWFPGDENHDDACNVLDLMAVQNALGSQPGNATWNPHVDFDQDGLISNVDINTVQTSLGLTSSTYWNKTLSVAAKAGLVVLGGLLIRVDNVSSAYTTANLTLMRGLHEIYVQPTLQDQYHNYTFSQWEDGSTENPRLYVLNATSTIIAYYDATNTAPNTPSQPSGATSGYVYTNYDYTTSATDPDLDGIYYSFYWNDSTSTTVGPYPSGATATATHQWTRPGTYQVKVRAKDVYGVWSLSNSTAKTVTISQNDANLHTDAGNSFSTATSVTPTLSFQGTLYQSSPTDTQDWYKFYAGYGQTIHVTMTPPSGVNFDLQLYSPNNPSTPVRSSTLGAGQTETITFTANASGDWRIRIYITSGEGQYIAYISVTGIGPRHPSP